MSFYQNSVRYAVETFAQNMIDCAHEYNAENFDSVSELADAALASTLDTVVRENIYNTLHDYEE